MLTYKQRYRPRTTREYTKSDLTVYDSADNTALNALTVYGKSEVVDGAIKSAGEGWATVDLGALAIERIATTEWTVFIISIPGIVVPQQIVDRIKGLLCGRYPISQYSTYTDMDDKSILRNGGYLIIKDSRYDTADALKNSLSDVMLAYELADPTQGNAIAIKTDNGSGIDGTMAVFETGTPLYGVSDTVRDVMMWDGSEGTVTKNCDSVDLSTTARTWTLQNTDNNRKLYYTSLGNMFDYSANYLPEGNFTRYNSVNELTEPYRTATSVQFNVLYVTIPVDADITIMDGIHFLMKLATPTVTPLTQTENESIAGLRTFAPQTHISNNARTDMTVNYTIKVPTI